MPRITLKRPPEFIPADDICLFLDFDGTLVRLAERPDDVVVDRALIALLDSLALRLSGRLALLSGRSIAQLDDMLRGMTIAMAGSHGGEIRHRDMVAMAVERPQALGIVETELADTFRDRKGVIVEVKTLGVAIRAGF